MHAREQLCKCMHTGFSSRTTRGSLHFNIAHTSQYFCKLLAFIALARLLSCRLVFTFRCDVSPLFALIALSLLLPVISQPESFSFLPWSLICGRVSPSIICGPLFPLIAPLGGIGLKPTAIVINKQSERKTQVITSNKVPYKALARRSACATKHKPCPQTNKCDTRRACSSTSSVSGPA